MAVGTPSAIHTSDAARKPGWPVHRRYVATDLTWAPRLPAHWGVRRVKYIAKLRTGHTPSRDVGEYWENCTIPWVSLTDVGKFRDGQRIYVEDTAEKISELGLANSAARLLPAGTVLLSRTASVGFPAILAKPMATTQDFVNWICGPELRPKYLYYCFRAMREEFRRITEGSTHQTIYWPDVEALSIPLPRLEEQEAIERILDHVGEEANRVIRAKERLIDLLIEHRAGVVIQAIREGIDPTAPRQNTDIDWAPSIPAGWSVRPLKCTVRGWRNGVWGEEPTGGDGDIAVIRVADFDRVMRRVVDGTRTRRLIPSRERAGRLLQAGDLLLEKSGGGDKQPVGAVVLWTHEASAVSSNFIARMPVAPGYDPSFICYLHQALYELRVNTRSIKQSTGIQNLDAEQYMAEHVPLPLPDEQREIRQHLEHETGRMDKVIASTRRHIELLREHRDAQVYAAVTGQIKVG